MEQGAKGNFRINFNTKKQAGDSQPVLERGIISTPDAPEETFEVKMWAYTDAAGRVFYAGPSSEIRRDAVGLDRAEALTLAEVRAVDVAEVEKSAETAEGITLSPHRVMLFRNGFKIAKSDPRHGALSDADKAVNDKRPDLYGFWNPGSDQSGKPRAQLKVSVWQQEGGTGRSWREIRRSRGLRKRLSRLQAGRSLWCDPRVVPSCFDGPKTNETNRSGSGRPAPRSLLEFRPCRIIRSVSFRSARAAISARITSGRLTLPTRFRSARAAISARIHRNSDWPN